MTVYYQIFLYSLLIGQILINMVIDGWVRYTTTLITMIIIIFGLFRFTSGNDTISQNIADNKDTLAYVVFSVVLMIAVSTFVLQQYYKDLMMSINQTVELQEDIERVLENLDEAIICKSKQGISFCNSVGFRILQNIQSILQHKDETTQSQSYNTPNTPGIPDPAGTGAHKPDNMLAHMNEGRDIKKALPESLLQNRFHFSGFKKKKKSQQRIENKILEAKIFEI